MRERIDIDIELLTPAFVSGADQEITEFRAASVRGLLRWWWRAVVGDRTNSVQELSGWESQIFGSVAQGKWKSPLRVSVREKNILTYPRGSGLPKSRFTYSYTAGSRSGKMDLLYYLAYGPFGPLTKDQRKKPEKLPPCFLEKDGSPKRGPLLIRPAVKEGSIFTIGFEWRQGSLSNEQMRDLVRALYCWTTIGGVGARSRKGFGQIEGRITSVSSGIKDIVYDTWDKTGETIFNSGRLNPRIPLPDFPQLEYRRVKLDTHERGDWTEALGAVGYAYRSLRKENGDAAWLTGYTRETEKKEIERRASSLLLGVTRKSERSYTGFLFFLPCRKNEKEEGVGFDRFLERFERLTFPK